MTRKIFEKKNIGSWSQSRILKVLVSEGVVSVSNGMVLVSVLVSDDEVEVSVLDDEAESPSLVECNKPNDNLFFLRQPPRNTTPLEKSLARFQKIPSM